MGRSKSGGRAGKLATILRWARSSSSCDQDLGQISLRVAEVFFNVFHIGSLAARRNVGACRLSDLCFAANFLRAAATANSPHPLICIRFAVDQKPGGYG